MAKTKDTTEPPSTTRAEVVDLSKEEVNIVTPGLQITAGQRTMSGQK